MVVIRQCWYIKFFGEFMRYFKRTVPRVEYERFKEHHRKRMLYAQNRFWHLWNVKLLLADRPCDLKAINFDEYHIDKGLDPVFNTFLTWKEIRHFTYKKKWTKLTANFLASELKDVELANAWELWSLKCDSFNFTEKVVDLEYRSLTHVWYKWSYGGYYIDQRFALVNGLNKVTSSKKIQFVIDREEWRLRQASKHKLSVVAWKRWSEKIQNIEKAAIAVEAWERSLLEIIYIQHSIEVETLARRRARCYNNIIRQYWAEDIYKRLAYVEHLVKKMIRWRESMWEDSEFGREIFERSLPLDAPDVEWTDHVPYFKYPELVKKDNAQLTKWKSRREFYRSLIKVYEADVEQEEAEFLGDTYPQENPIFFEQLKKKVRAEGTLYAGYWDNNSNLNKISKSCNINEK